MLFSYVPSPKIFLFVAHIHRSKGGVCRLRERGGWGGDKRSLAPTVRARRRRVAIAMEAGAGTLNGGEYEKCLPILAKEGGGFKAMRS